MAGQFAALGCGVLIMGYLTRRLGLLDYGRYALTILLSSWIGIAIGAMSGAATIRLVAGSLNGRRYAVTSHSAGHYLCCHGGGIAWAWR